MNSKIYSDTKEGKTIYLAPCIIRGQGIELKPEEIVRQLYIAKLISEYNYSKNLIGVEVPITFGSGISPKRIDIVIYDKQSDADPYVVIELKSPSKREGINQLKSYCNATAAPIAIWTNGNKIHYYQKEERPTRFIEIRDLPKSGKTLKSILENRYTLKHLIINDKIATTRKSLKNIITEIEDAVLSNAGVDSFEEVFKLIFIKLYDEFLSMEDKNKIEGFLEQNISEFESQNFDNIKNCLNEYDDSRLRELEFRNTDQADGNLKENLEHLFYKAKNKWQGVFTEDSKIELSDSHLSVCVGYLQDIKLFNSNLLVVDEAFEYLVTKVAKGDKGQFFTPRHVIDMCVQMLHPKKGEYMIDTASGSCGFPIHTIFKIIGHLFSNKELRNKDKEDVLKIFGIDFDEKAVRVARTLNLIAGDGETNVLHLNTLDFSRWRDKEKDPTWQQTYGKGYKRLMRLREDRESDRKFKFDILMANPPFAGRIEERRILREYDFGITANGRVKDRMRREILFIERNFDFVKPGGRLAIVLPQGIFTNLKIESRVREMISEKSRILAVISLGDNTFKPHTSPKTSVLFAQKWDDIHCPRKNDYPIFFGVSHKSGKDSRGNYIYTRDSNGQPNLDQFGHLIIDHDLHNHASHIPDGLSEAFMEFSRREKLSFADEPHNEKKFKSLIKSLNINIVNLSNSLNRYHRLDAEYYEKKYAPYTTITHHNDDFIELGEICSVNKSIEPGSENYSETGIPFIRVQNLHEHEIRNENMKYLSNEYVMNNDLENLILRRNTILFTKDGRVGTAYYLENDLNAITSSAILHLNVLDEDVVLPRYLYATLNSKFVRNQAHRGMTGAIIKHWNPELIRRVMIPIVSLEKQQEISEKVRMGYEYKKRSENHFLDTDKKLDEEIGRISHCHFGI